MWKVHGRRINIVPDFGAEKFQTSFSILHDDFCQINAARAALRVA